MPKSKETKAEAFVFQVRDLLVRQRTQIINTLRGRLAEFGFVALKGPAHAVQLVQAVVDAAEPIPERARPTLRMLITMSDGLEELDPV